jgi:hypothetical protein
MLLWLGKASGLGTLFEKTGLRSVLNGANDFWYSAIERIQIHLTVGFQ